eukprot:CAMPEP_0206458624 /NCGR_PEP_ID=MMETSP0324_2-20121206/23681_1 /ASSEMBLY_ACC=CAM_ASM_000836 /TAXON_ID=2866 /ORGANISM="Crypthecodinium cohnii, Strain Seligo" /LENGTH=324 /DNA_ID=CAMNT_0053929999 /DNA_START=55 /DNA_END=1029 /DNA_ORIENTATION=-
MSSSLKSFCLGAGVAALSVAGVRGSSNMTCQFDVDPIGPGYYWDPDCSMGMLGCRADGVNDECRLCGHGDYSEIPCPPTSCKFVNEPIVQYYWDVNCTLGELGCWADGVHAECRFCGDSPYTTLECPEVTGGGVDPADAAPSDACHFPNEPTIPYYWDESCEMGKLGCNADGVNVHCRFCAGRPFEDIPCPEGVGPDPTRCGFPAGSEPTEELYYWDSSCKMGMLGCWADGVNAQCRFCGGTGSYASVPCPSVILTGETEETSEEPAAGSQEASNSMTENRHSGPKPVSMDINTQQEDEVVSLSGAYLLRPLGLVVLGAFAMMA